MAKFDHSNFCPAPSGSQFTDVSPMRLQVHPGALGAEVESHAPYECHSFKPISETVQGVIQNSQATEIFPDASQCKWHETYGGRSAWEETGPDLFQQEDDRPCGQIRGQYPENPRGMSDPAKFPEEDLAIGQGLAFRSTIDKMKQLVYFF